MPGFRLVTLAAALLGGIAPVSAQETNYARLYEALWTAVNDNFYDPHFRGTDWAAQRDRYRSARRSARATRLSSRPSRARC